jgi:putative NADH-flavin reductase
MKIVLIGATGFVGTHVLKELVGRGHQVTAVLRNPDKLASAGDLVMPVRGDVFDTDKLASLVAGHDAVISTYNPGWTNPEIYSDFIKGSESIRKAVAKSGVKRLLVVGGAGSLEIAPGVQLIDTPDFPAEYKPGASAARDFLYMIRQDTDLDWTFLSPAIEMHPGTSGERKGSYRTGLDNPVFNEKGRSIISAEDLAVAIVDEIEEPRFIGRRFTVAY